MRKLNLEELDIGVKIDGRIINKLRYADDTTLLAEKEEDLKLSISRLKEVSELKGTLSQL